MEEGISRLYREGSEKEPTSPLSTGFPEPRRLDIVEDGTAFTSSASIPSTPVSPQRQSVKFDDRIGKLQDEDDEKKEKKGYTHILRFGFFPPRGVVGKVITRLLALLIWYGVLWGTLGPLALPAPVPDASHSSGGRITCNASIEGHHDTSHYCTLDLSSSLTSVLDDHCPNKTHNEDYIVETSHPTRSGANAANCNITTGKGYLVGSPHSTGEGSNHVNDSNGTSCTKSFRQECIERCLCEDPSHHHEEHTLAGHFFGLFVLTIVSAFFGFLAHAIRLPHLFGMMIGGILLNNLPVVGVARNIDHDWSAGIRTGALVVVLIRGGLSMELSKSMCIYEWTYICTYV